MRATHEGSTVVNGICDGLACWCRPEVPQKALASNERTLVRHVCTAYESGFGHGREGRDLGNPYVPLSSAWEAYEYGHKEGAKRRSEVETRAEPANVAAIRARCAQNITEVVANPAEFYRVQQILRDRVDLLAEVDRLRAPFDWGNPSLPLLLRHVVNHWNEFGPEHDFERLIDLCEKRLNAPAQVETRTEPVCTCGKTFMRADCPKHGDPAALTGAARPGNVVFVEIGSACSVADDRKHAAVKLEGLYPDYCSHCGSALKATGDADGR